MINLNIKPSSPQGLYIPLSDHNPLRGFLNVDRLILLFGFMAIIFNIFGMFI